MGQRIPTRTEPSDEEVKTYIRDMLFVLLRLASDSELPTIAGQLQAALDLALPELDQHEEPRKGQSHFQPFGPHRSA